MTPDLRTYDRILVAFSGGKDSLACLLHLFELGVPARLIELHHHDVDGEGGDFMDWPCTPAYCQAMADAFALPIYFSGRRGGFEREMSRQECPTAPVYFDTPQGRRETGGKGPPGTRGKFPQVAADLRVRWCSAYLKIDVMDALIRNQPRFKEGRTLVVTGERAQESPARAKYKTFEPHRTHGASRHVDHWRPVHGWDERQVWEIIERHGVLPHPAYRLGWGRLSCLSCIFGSPDQWATIRAVFPEHFERIAAREEACGVTIQRRLSVRELADAGTPYAAALENPELVATSQLRGFDYREHVLTNAWELPAGAYGENAGPS